VPTKTIQHATAAPFGAETLPLVERLGPSLEAMDVFRRLAALPRVIFFDSAMRHAHLGRYSFVAADPVDWIELPAGGGDATAVWPRLAESRMPVSDSYDDKRDLPPFQGGWAGLFGYELGRSLETVPAAARDEFRVPAMAIGLYDVVFAFDHEQQAAWIVSQGFPEVDVSARRERAKARLAWFRKLIVEGTNGKQKIESPSLLATLSSSPATSPVELAPQFAVQGQGQLTSNFSAEGYRRAVRRAIDYIYAGDVYQVNLSQRLLHPAEGSPIELYCRLRARSPAPFAAYFDAGPCQIVSASPERFLHVAAGHVETRPIKGTCRRSAESAADDDKTASALLASDKDRAENIMIVDLLRNDLSRTCRPESVQVSQLCGLESYAAVHHLVSVVEGRLRDDQSAIDLLRTCFPGGSITGAPKVRAMEIIAELEPTARGAYCGALGYLSADGSMDSSVLIRTITAGRGWWQLPVGGGIVALSDPENEHAETWHKAAGMLAALRP
jgi:para-aminobenzoate synthetase component I